ncbi:bifunctional UDP-N-acetylglucosamine diphosphorylase/glucosamine-1-phosphate N-acetyltransferase GlmU [Syntrophorhabdus aromaticivorans]|uniref:Bifunctional protein GlmU n=1 Tax=Syntrophorhabdus aromaticivorans TaxID=328301 RepID=A0A971S0H3_9BACT|nr:bifunctional UDP-N-acetylglucosamine diphosphorylase/glucosamine-1-phosphate N-acetyltransferase GlmU [Syntrophorhabdus aromaticivorans]NLW35163.1 bifunctional UDP-N-acetylglucosamine diphosphorylase/glucosamine-1-phosphate N-acetyltransferase GlmU [Syntrophorhabdus aromaticivorans]
MQRLSVVILAAGKGERMLSKKPKVMHEIMGKPMVSYVVRRAKELLPTRIVVVLGHGRELVEGYLKEFDVECAVQEEQKGTAHALLTAEESVHGDDVLVLYGDVPLIEGSTLNDLLSFYEKDRAVVFMTTKVENPFGYGRVIVEGDRIERIVEEIDATPEEKEVRRINTGICLIPGELFGLLKKIGPDNRKGEYYLTDICRVAGQEGIKVRAYDHPRASEVLGINSRKELLDANITMKDRILEAHMGSGVSFLDRNIYVDADVTIGKDTTVYPNTYLMGKTRIGEDVTIGPNVLIRDSVIHDRVSIEGFVVMEGAEVETGAKVGPFSRVRPATVLRRGVEIGNFVEVKNSRLDEDTKANHLAYIGDSEVGKDVNIGAGTITCNYDGTRKHTTVIEDRVFVGSNTELVAPVRIGRNAVVGAGSTITRDVPEGALAVTRVEQRHVEGYGRGRRRRCVE